MPVGTLGPFPLPAANAVGAQVTIIPSGQFGDPNALGDVLINNFSGYLLGVTSSSSGALLNLSPASANVYPAPAAGGSLVITVLSGSAGSAHPSVSAQVGLMGEEFSGAYPQSLPGVSTGPAATLLGVIPAGDISVVVTPDPSATAIMATSVVTGGPSLGFTVTGTPSGIVLRDIPFSSQQGVAPLPLGATDLSYTVSLFAALPGATYVWQLSGQPVVTIGNLPTTDVSGGINAGANTLAVLTLDEWDNVHSVTSGTSSLAFTPQDYTQELVIVADQPVSSVAGAANPMPIRCLQTNPYTYWLPWVAEFSCTVTLAAAAGATWYVAELQAGGYRAAGLNAQPVTVDLPNPAAGANWSYTLPFNARVAHIGAVFVTSSTAADRYPYMNFLTLGHGNAFDGMAAGTPMTAGSAYNLSWQAGPGFVPYLSQGANAWIAAIPDYGVLPAGTVIESGVAGLQATDQWSNVSLVLAPA